MYKILILLSIFFSLSLVAGPKFTFVFKCGSQICLINKFDLNQDVTILTDTKLCYAKTIKNITGTNEVSNFPATLIGKMTCGFDRKNAIVAVVGRKYSSIKIYNPTDIKKTYDKNLLEPKLKIVIDADRRNKNPSIKPFLLRPPKVSKIDQNLNLVRFYVDDKPVGPAFIDYGDNKLESIGGICSLPTKLFDIDNKRYLIGGYTCCSCGDYLKKIYSIESNRTKIVHQDNSLAT